MKSECKLVIRLQMKSECSGVVIQAGLSNTAPSYGMHNKPLSPLRESAAVTADAPHCDKPPPPACVCTDYQLGGAGGEVITGWDAASATPEQNPQQQS